MKGCEKKNEVRICQVLDEDFMNFSIGLRQHVPRKVSFRVVSLAVFYGWASSALEKFHLRSNIAFEMFDGEGVSILDMFDEDDAEQIEGWLEHHTVDYGTGIKSQLARTQLTLRPCGNKFDHANPPRI